MLSARLEGKILEPCQEPAEICDLVLFSKASVHFTLERIMHRVGSHVVTIWASDECISETTEVSVLGSATLLVPGRCLRPHVVHINTSLDLPAAVDGKVRSVLYCQR